MKKYFLIRNVVCIISVGFLSASPLLGQSFFKKLKNKISAATESVVNEAIPENIKEKEILPAKGNSPSELFAQLPNILSEGILLDPLEEKERNNYKDKLSSIEMRMWELSDISSEGYDEMEEDMEKKAHELEKKATAMIGLTEAEMKELEDPNTSEERIKELENKIVFRTTGMTSEQVNKMENMSEKEMQAYAMQNVDKSKLNKTIDKAKEISQDEFVKDNQGLGALSNKFLSEFKLIDSTFKANLNSSFAKSKNYTKELEIGYKTLYLTSSSSERDILTDKLNIINEKGRKETIYLWRNAYAQAVKSLNQLSNDMILGLNNKKGLNDRVIMDNSLECLRQAIAYCREAIYFDGFRDVKVAQERVIQSNISNLFSDECSLFFTTSSGISSAAGSGETCGSFIESYFVVTVERDTIIDYHVSHKGKLSKSYSSPYQALKTIPEPDNSKYDIASSKSKYESVGGKRYVIKKDENFILNDGSVYRYPFAIYSCNDYLYWLIFRNGSIIECSYRL